MALTKAPKEMLDVDLASKAYVDNAVAAAGGGAVSVGPANPESITVRSTSYTIPAGKSARVRFTRADGELNGSAVFQNQTFSTGTISTTAAAVGTYWYRFFQFEGTVFITGTMGAPGNATSYLTTQSSPTGTYFTTITGTGAPTPNLKQHGPSTSTSSFSFHFTSNAPTDFNYLLVDTSSSFSATGSCSISNYRILRDNVYWVPSGTVVGGTGMIVEEYINT